MEVRPLQDAKAQSPMLVTLLGIVVLLHPAINVLDDVSIIALQLLRESYLVFPFSTTMVVKSQQSTKAKYPMLITLLGIMMEGRPQQYAKA